MQRTKNFSLRKKAVGIYFNDGGHIVWVQQDKDVTEPDAKLAEAIAAAWTTFRRIYFARSPGARKHET